MRGAAAWMCTSAAYTACLITPEGQTLRTFRAPTAELREFAHWLRGAQRIRAAMESTGIYWLPIFNVMEEAQIVSMLVNACHMKALPGWKTDVKDAEWICATAR